MENTNSEERCIHLLYSPCSLFEQLFNTLFKCLGGGHDQDHDRDHHEDPKTQQVDTNSTSEAETEMKNTGEEFEALARRPSRPPISSGGGGQIN
ncbi:hypothetical protein ACOSQ4_022291 [Xanthoceras sorbifolium]